MHNVRDVFPFLNIGFEFEFGFHFAGVAVDQGIAYVLMLVALAITYIIH